MNQPNPFLEGQTGPPANARPRKLGVIAVMLTLIALSLATAREITIQRELERIEDERMAEEKAIDLGLLRITFQRKGEVTASAEPAPEIRAGATHGRLPVSG